MVSFYRRTGGAAEAQGTYLALDRGRGVPFSLLFVHTRGVPQPSVIPHCIDCPIAHSGLVLREAKLSPRVIIIPSALISLESIVRISFCLDSYGSDLFARSLSFRPLFSFTYPTAYI